MQNPKTTPHPGPLPSAEREGKESAERDADDIFAAYDYGLEI
jgi:hypothetical protein